MSDMADVLMDHHSKSYDAELGTVFCLDPTCGWNTQAHNFAIAAEEFAAHQAAALSAAGFGPVQEAAAAALRSVDDIWGSEGRSIVRLSELREASQKVLSGGWDNHIKWNMADIARERARAVAERGEG